MATEPPQQRGANLLRLRFGAYIWHRVYVLAVLFLLPRLTEGTAFHEHAMLIRDGGIVGVFLGPAYGRWLNWVVAWHHRTGRDIGSAPTYVPAVLIGVLPGTLAAYVALRLLHHEGDWTETLAYSETDGLISLGANVLIALLGGLASIIIVSYRRGENVVFRGGEPHRFRHIVYMLLLLPAFALLIGFVSWLA